MGHAVEAAAMETRLPEVVDYGLLDRMLAEGAAGDYRTAKPFPHIMIDGLLPEEVARAAEKEISASDIGREKTTYSTFEKYRLSERDLMGPVAGSIIDELNSPRFCSYLERLTGIPNLRSDPTLEGGGVHRIGAGGYLKIHSDFNYHRLLRAHRRLNILLYLNSTWNEDWGGAIELWDSEMKGCVAAYPPLFNRAVLFTTTDESFHGHPEPLKSPPGVWRHSIALYYYTQQPGADGRHFDRSVMTNYQQRPGERFGRLFWLNQLEIRVPFVRLLTEGIKRRLR